MKKTGWMAALAAAVALWAGMAWGAVGVTNVVVHQRYPWNGMVDIDYEVVCDDADADVWVCPNGVDADRGRTLPMFALSGEGAGSTVKPGKHRMTWNADADAPGEHVENFQVTMTAVVGASLYLVVDLSGGPAAESWPVRPSGTGPDLNDDGCRTTNLWLRLIPPGTFTMGSPSNELGRANYDGTQHEVTISAPFYLGVFEFTQKQWELAMGTRPSYFSNATHYATRPVEKVSYDDLRGTLNGSAWPKHGQVDEDSFFGVLRAKTALQFDLPTEAQWEYACRAGTTTALNSGKNLTDAYTCTNMAEVGRYSENWPSGSTSYNNGNVDTNYGTAKVGSYLPNAWGLYDMHGNVLEWCLDWMQESRETTAVTDPKGPTSGIYSDRVVRGGNWYAYPKFCRSASRSYHNYTFYPSSREKYSGFRPAMILPQ